MAEALSRTRTAAELNRWAAVKNDHYSGGDLGTR